MSKNNDIPGSKEKIAPQTRPHPWHGIAPQASTGDGYINAFIEMVPSDTVKYELDKETGFLKIDRPQKFSNNVPTLYGFIPRTFCGSSIGNRASESTGRKDIKGDKDPLDICVLTESHINHGDLVLTARPIGGFRMIDSGEADDKIVAVLKDDPIYGGFKDIKECPPAVIARIRHYFLTYKTIPGGKEDSVVCTIDEVYGREEAQNIIELSCQDYRDQFC